MTRGDDDMPDRPEDDVEGIEGAGGEATMAMKTP